MCVYLCVCDTCVYNAMHVLILNCVSACACVYVCVCVSVCVVCVCIPTYANLNREFFVSLI